MLSVTVRVITDEDTNAGFDLDLQDHEDFPISITYNVSDVNFIGGITSSYSKSFVIPATKQNNKNLQNIYYSSTDDTQNIRGLNRCAVYVNNMSILKGKFRVSNVINNNGVLSYECVIYGDNYTWIDVFRNTSLRDLDFSSSNHNYDTSTVEASWTDGGGGSADADDRDYVYPVISYGRFTDDDVALEDLRPAIYIKSILDKSWDHLNNSVDTNYTISSTFLESTTFKRMVMPFTLGTFKTTINKTDGEDIEADSLAEASYLFFQNVDNYEVSSENMEEVLVIDNVLTGNDQTTPSENHWDETTYEYVAPESCKVQLDFECEAKEVVGNIKPRDVEFALVKVDFLGTKTIIASTKHSGSLTYKDVKLNVDNIFLFTGDKLKIVMYPQEITETVTFTTAITNVTVSDDVPIAFAQTTKVRNSIINVIKSDDIVDGQQVSLSDMLPDDKVSDFFKGVANLFNLYATTNEDTKTITIEPRDDFYQDTNNSVDWTSKLDHNSGYRIKHLDEYRNTLEFNYKKDDKDALVDRFNNVNDVKLGSSELDLDNRYPDGISSVTNNYFAATIHQRVNIGRKENAEAVDRFNILPCMWNALGYDGIAPAQSYDYQPRILYYNYQTQLDSDGNNITWRYEGDLKTSLPTGYFLEDFDDTTTTGYNLTFEGTTGLTELYYEGEVRQINEGIMLSANFDLTYEDINALDISKPVHISAPSEISGYYTINKISDYRPTKSVTTRVELIKIVKTDKKTTKAKNNNDGAKWVGKDFSGKDKFYSGGKLTEGGLKRSDSRDKVRDKLEELESYDTALNDKFSNPTSDVKYSGEAARRGRESFELNNGGDNLAKEKSGSTAFGWGTQALGDKQTALGSYNKPDPTAKLIIGGGTDDNNRSNVMTVDRNGKSRMYGGEVLTENTDGDIMNVYVETRDGIEKVYLSDD